LTRRVARTVPASASGGDGSRVSSSELSGWTRSNDRPKRLVLTDWQGSMGATTARPEARSRETLKRCRAARGGRSRGSRLLNREHGGFSGPVWQRRRLVEEVRGGHDEWGAGDGGGELDNSVVVARRVPEELVLDENGGGARTTVASRMDEVRGPFSHAGGSRPARAVGVVLHRGGGQHDGRDTRLHPSARPD
jgi:hypothetical protein